MSLIFKNYNQNEVVWQKDYLFGKNYWVFNEKDSTTIRKYLVWFFWKNIPM